MQVQTFQTDKAQAPDACADLLDQILAGGTRPDFVSIHFNPHYPIGQMRAGLADLAGTAVHGATSCLGTMTGRGHQTAGTQGAGAFCLYDPEGDYGSAAGALGADPRAAARLVTQAALGAADRVGEAPALIWLSVTPGCEEQVITGIEDVVGTAVPIVGGSAADNDVSGNWAVMDGHADYAQGVVISVLFPSGEVAFAYQSGYVPTAQSGIATHVDGRHLIEIDHRPAAQVYAEWTEGAIASDGLGAPQNILSASTFWPFGREVAQVMGVPYHLLAHPATIEPNGALSLFADVAQGERLVQMSGTPAALTDRAGRVALQAVRALDPAQRRVCGALMIYCGGCMLGVRDRMDDVVDGVRDALGQAPFLGLFTFGEQGPVLGSGNRHGNLMISAVVFSERL